ncbi:hypothetical protein CSC82_12700 [Rhodobacteraceae bacterium 4F10]|nr:hypothetical protein CSC82_12700 [Rhodobacteraceae bacterium 4F10]
MADLGCWGDNRVAGVARIRKLSWVIDIAGQGARGIGKMLQTAAFQPVLLRSRGYIGFNLTHGAQK